MAKKNNANKTNKKGKNKSNSPKSNKAIQQKKGKPAEIKENKINVEPAVKQVENKGKTEEKVNDVKVQAENIKGVEIKKVKVLENATVSGEANTNSGTIKNEAVGEVTNDKKENPENVNTKGNETKVRKPRNTKPKEPQFYEEFNEETVEKAIKEINNRLEDVKNRDGKVMDYIIDTFYQNDKQKFIAVNPNKHVNLQSVIDSGQLEISKSSLYNLFGRKEMEIRIKEFDPEEEGISKIFKKLSTTKQDLFLKYKKKPEEILELIQYAAIEDKTVRDVKERIDDLKTTSNTYEESIGHHNFREEEDEEMLEIRAYQRHWKSAFNNILDNRYYLHLLKDFFNSWSLTLEENKMFESHIHYFLKELHSFCNNRLNLPNKYKSQNNKVYQQPDEDLNSP